MDELVDFYTAAVPHSEYRETRLVEEIAYLEARLHQLGSNGDCAYERSLVRTYSALLKARRDQLAAFDPAPRLA